MSAICRVWDALGAVGGIRRTYIVNAFRCFMPTQVQWDRSPDFTSGMDGEAEGQVEVDATQELCADCVTSFVLDDLTLALNGDIDFFGRLNAGNRILVGRASIFCRIPSPFIGSQIRSDQTRSGRFRHCFCCRCRCRCWVRDIILVSLCSVQ